MRPILSIAAGAALGGVARYILGGLVQARVDGEFPAGTLAVNVAGCFLVGVFLRLSMPPTEMSPDLRLFLTTGFCGGFTTFSAFSAETLALMQQGRYGKAGTYVALSVTLGLAATFAGFTAVDQGSQRGG